MTGAFSSNEDTSGTIEKTKADSNLNNKAGNLFDYQPFTPLTSIPGINSPLKPSESSPYFKHEVDQTTQGQSTPEFTIGPDGISSTEPPN